MGRIRALPEESAFHRKHNEGHTSLHELIAQTRDAVVTTAHGWRIQGRPEPYKRPKVKRPRDEETVELGNPEDVGAITRFFGKPHR